MDIKEEIKKLEKRHAELIRLIDYEDSKHLGSGFHVVDNRRVNELQKEADEIQEPDFNTTPPSLKGKLPDLRKQLKEASS